MPIHTRSQVEDNIRASSLISFLIIMVAFALLVQSIWRFVPASGQLIILIGVPLIGCLVIWGRYIRLWLQRHAGQVLLNLDVPCQLNSWWAIGFYLITGIVLLLSYFKDSSNDGVIRLAWGVAFLTMAVTNGLENQWPIVVTDDGFCSTRIVVLPWRAIQLYVWESDEVGSAKLRVLYKKSRFYRGVMTIQVPIVHKEALISLLAQKIGG